MTDETIGYDELRLRDAMRNAHPYRYREWGGHPCPCVEIAICRPDMRHAFRVEALIDTGAVASSLPGGALPYFGIAAEDCEPVGSFTVAGANSEALRPREQIDVVAELAIPDTHGDYFRFVLEDMRFYPRSAGAILGRDFLHYFDMTVAESVHTVFLEPLPAAERVTRT
jgi:hypothetical protein